MKSPKAAVEVTIDQKDPNRPAPLTKEAYQCIIDAYASQNPKKYAAKKEALATRLAGLPSETDLAPKPPKAKDE